MIALTDPHDSTLRESLESLVQRPVEYVVTSKKDILQIIDRVYGFRSSVRGAEEHLGAGNRGPGLVQMVQLRSGEELASTAAQRRLPRSSSSGRIASYFSRSQATTAGFGTPQGYNRKSRNPNYFR